MKQNNKFNKFNRNNQLEKQIHCSCGAKAKLKIRKNYPYGRKSKGVTSRYYQCEKCGEIKFATEKQKGGKK